MTKNKRKAMELLRKAATALSVLTAKDIREDATNDPAGVLFPGWDFDNVLDSETAIYGKIASAARGISADNIDFDQSNYVSFTNLSHLVRYIGDMLEE
jgi:hypothetical protein